MMRGEEIGSGPQAGGAFRWAPSVMLLLALAVPALGIAANTTGSEPNGRQDVEKGGPKTEPEKKPPKPQQQGITEEVQVRARADDLTGIATSGTEGVTGGSDLELRPKLRPGELVETVPGVVATQHSGGGKANQYFLRGFNLDHGTDFRIAVEGMPVNQPSHGHGQGYADLNFLIPELIDSAHFRKGPYYPEVGDFSAAGSVEFRLVRSLPEPRVEVEGGDLGFRRALAAGSRPFAGGDLLGAVELFHYDGPWEHPDDFRKGNAVVRYSRGDADRGFSLLAMGYDGTWDATDQIPKRAVAEGIVGTYGQLDPDLGGRSGRFSVSGMWHGRRGATLSRASAFVESYHLHLLSNFTYFLDDPAEGDQFLQLDRRVVMGGSASRRRALHRFGHSVVLGYGGDVRFDFIRNGLFHTVHTVVDRTIRRDRIQQLMGGVFAELTARPVRWFRVQGGLRVDTYLMDVASDLDVNSGRTGDDLVSPKLSVVFGPWARTEYYVNLGYGYHSNDARGATIRVDPRTGEPVRPVDPLVRARGMDVGFRTTAVRGLQTTVSAFLLEMDSELVFVGDAGTTEPGRPSRRKGVEVANFYSPAPWLSFDLDAAWTTAEFTDRDPAGSHIPGAIEKVLATGITLRNRDGFSGSLRWRYFGPRPLIEDGSVYSGSTSLVNARAAYRFRKGMGLALEVFNLFDRRDSDIQYYYASRLPGEPPGGVEDVHFHPMESRSYRFVLDWRL